MSASTPLSRFWEQFAENRVAVVALFVVVAFVGLALLAPLVDLLALRSRAMTLRPCTLPLPEPARAAPLPGAKNVGSGTAPLAGSKTWRG